jgi:hypothetical protein
MQITAAIWRKVEDHYHRPCELNERGEILYRDQNYPVGYIASDCEYDGWLVDVTGDYDKLVCDLNA